MDEIARFPNPATRSLSFGTYGTGLTAYLNFLLRAFPSRANLLASRSSSKILTPPNDSRSPSLFILYRNTTYFDLVGVRDSLLSLGDLPSTTLLFFRPTASLSDLLELLGLDDGLEFSEILVWVAMIKIISEIWRTFTSHG